MRPTNIEETQMINYAISCELHLNIITYKGFSDNRFVDFLNKYHRQCDMQGNKSHEFESVTSCSIRGEMCFSVFFTDGNQEATIYSFKSERVKNWLRNYMARGIARIEWN